MKSSNLSDYFEGVAAKKLSAVEACPETSNQHEFNGVRALKDLLGPDKLTVDASFLYLSDDQSEPVVSNGFLTWYDSRENVPERSPEFRLYFPPTSTSELWNADDLVVFGKRKDGSISVIVAEAGSSHESTISWLFQLPNELADFFHQRPSDEQLNVVANQILEDLGVDVQLEDDSLLDQLLDRFGPAFPTTRIFSAFARDTLRDVDPVQNPDDTILAWMGHEEVLFRTLEKHIVKRQLEIGFEGDVDFFLKYSLSVQNRRKSRVGHAFENHLEQLFIDNEIRYSRGQITEGKSRPDFLFPGVEEYHDLLFPTESLSMLGAKTTLKDRWRQVLVEAERIPLKHLITLQPSISVDQTDEMRAHSVQLVIPATVHSSYTGEQRDWLWSTEQFLQFALRNQNS